MYVCTCMLTSAYVLFSHRGTMHASLTFIRLWCLQNKHTYICTYISIFYEVMKQFYANRCGTSIIPRSVGYFCKTTMNAYLNTYAYNIYTHIYTLHKYNIYLSASIFCSSIIFQFTGNTQSLIHKNIKIYKHLFTLI